MPKGILTLGRITNQHYKYAMTSATAPTTLAGMSVAITSLERSNPATAILITVEDNPIRFTTDGKTAPSAATSTGHNLAAGQSLYLTSVEDIQNFQAVNSTAGVLGVLQISVEFGRKGQL